jgi:TonB family protein
MFLRVLFLSCLLLTFSSVAIADESVTKERDRQAVADFSTCAKPVWPIESVKQQQTGTVTFIFLIAVDGQVADAVIKKSSGHLLLDEATLEAVKKCKFRPGIKDGKPMAAWMRMQYVWTFE